MPACSKRAGEGRNGELAALVSVEDLGLAEPCQCLLERRVKNARFPVLKTLEDFQWSWPRKINRRRRFCRSALKITPSQSLLFRLRQKFLQRRSRIRAITYVEDIAGQVLASSASACWLPVCMEPM
jgi:hypothetical protein